MRLTSAVGLAVALGAPLLATVALGAARSASRPPGSPEVAPLGAAGSGPATDPSGG